jgi:pimeloyl-ACP methyl ester carboxylesterase
MVAVHAASRAPALFRGLIVGDAPLFASEKYRSRMAEQRPRLEASRAIAGGSTSTPDVIRALKLTPVEKSAQRGAGPDAASRRTPGEGVTLGDLFPEGHAFFDWMAANLSQNDPEFIGALLEDLDALLSDFELSHLARISCPVLILRADPELDESRSDEEIETALSILPNASVEVLKGVGHPLQDTHPQVVGRAIQGFLESLQR